MTRTDRTPQPDKPRSRRRRASVALLLLFLLFGWWLWPDGRLAKARALQTNLFTDVGKTLTPEQRRAKFEELRSVTRQMSESQRRELSQDMTRRRQADLERYVRLSPAEKRQQLDRDINRQEEMRKRMQANSNAGGPPRTGPGGGLGGPPRSGRPSTPEDRERHRQQRLDQSTPQYRELRDQYHRDLDARRKERGLPPPPPFHRPR